MEIKAERVTLRTTTREDLGNLMKLWNDGRVMKWVGFPDGLGYDWDDMNDWFTRIESDPARHHFVVLAPQEGFCGEVYYAVEEAHQRAGLDIKLAPRAQGRGLAADAFKTLIDHVFETEPEVMMVWTQPNRDNLAAKRLYTRCGLQPGTRPADIYTGESFWGLSRADWESGMPSG